MQMATTLGSNSEARKKVPLYRGLLRYFPAALAWVARIAQIGNDKHCPGGELAHARGISADHADCILRHMLDMSEDFGHGVGYDENGVPQVAYIAWRANALAQEWLEEHEALPYAPAANFDAVTQTTPDRAMDRAAADAGYLDTADYLTLYGGSQ